ncbi:DUF6477 family protein [uncultured Lentibacter sp.]|uniref:DUF6477 family protein n=1 Tax=uncultured Lentibacter sp. TaxID=1659309 RepID=UPI002611C76C|nr:DUF6477 family protein [uncultured Lentibacter sp.]
MQDPLSRFEALRRPGLLLKAAEAGLRQYMRTSHLTRALGRYEPSQTIAPAEALADLLELEHSLNEKRRQNEAGYSYLRHIEVLIATLAEAQLLRATAARTPAE